MNVKARFFISSAMLIAVFMVVAGCGETVRGIGRDASRIGHGVKTVFISD
ncbi:MAG: hypothetical protein Q8R76_05895 [Candidatus Omnitrophota bacterium]|nr:hypothetical protein [Candidatus Omnitrophota bacterium]